MGPGLNPMEAARDVLGIDIPDEWQEPAQDRASLLADPVLRGVAELLYTDDRAFLGAMPHLRSIL